ncbi:TIGR01440 family protein [Virgibacillus sp. MSP4-1]|uniref:TIGR01440 family protein n=1 Tax=Virgibacillus sp. MSP4-1 TaxID=2700081 RepID=UPI0003A4DB10|nr:TIGR01440 family protein [Virgibacillus sp. MSP4-1]QHS23571.1 TIGR01440 family protein [Virgibacillus sp. MSP4-1]
MTDLQTEIKSHLKELVDDWCKGEHLQPGQLFVLGCSTSEVAGERIGTSGSEEIASVIFQEMQRLQKETGAHLAFQCCEHLNRSLVVERAAMEKYAFTEVSAVPVPKAGGSMAAYAYRHMEQPVLVESITAHAGMDIGDTFIGMHLKPVAVPVRLSRKNLGEAHVTAAYTRPKLIGGERAVYSLPRINWP